MLITSAFRAYFEEADEYLAKGDTVQASEKYYKAAEEAIKYLAYVNYIEIKDLDLKTLNDVVVKLSKNYGKDIIEWWDSATALITTNLSVHVIKLLREDIRKLVEIADREFNSQMAKRG